MGQGQSAPVPLANAASLCSGLADVLPMRSSDQGCSGSKATELHKWMNIVVPHASIEVASMDQHKTSKRLIEDAPMDRSSTSESSREATPEDQRSTSKKSIEVAPLYQGSTLRKPMKGELMDESNSLERSIEAARADESSISKRCRDDNLLSLKHSIFLSHSGAQKSFVEQLCLDVERHDRYPFFDKRRDSLPIGAHFPKLIFEAIDQCQVGVVVLSEEFFSRSTWPLLEFAALVERKARDPMFTIMPVFLGLTHGQCRDKANQKRWLEIWEGWARGDDRIKVKEWQEALRVFGPTNGINLNDKKDEVKCREEIVEVVCKRIGPNTRWDDSHVQGRSRLSSVIGDEIGRVEVCKSYGVRVLGIWGVGGIGKTTTCKVLCNEYFKEFEGRVCHVEFEVGDMLGMVREVLRRLTDTSLEVIGRFSIGEEVVDNAKELLRLGFIEGSIIVVTARSLLQLQNLNLEDCIQMPELEEDDARSLFLYHAAPNMYLKSVLEMNEQVVNKCLERCYFCKGNGMDYHYHPLALKVLGGQLGNKVDEWMAKLELYEGDPFNQYGEEEKDHPVFSILGRSFEILKDEDKLLFMDVAISIPHVSLWDVNIFEWLSWVHGRSLQEIMRRLEGLRSKSLLEDLGDGPKRIALHDLWHDYARMKANGKRFDQQPWILENVYEVNDPQRRESELCGGGWESCQRIWIVSASHGRNCVNLMELDLSRCSNLRVLVLRNVKIETQVLDLGVSTQFKSLTVVGPWDDDFEVYFVKLGSLRNLAFLRLFNVVTNLTVLLEDIASLTNLRQLEVYSLSHKMRIGPLTLGHKESTIGHYWRTQGWSAQQSKGKGVDAIVESEVGNTRNLAGVVGRTLVDKVGYPTWKDSTQGKELVLIESPSMGNVEVVPMVLTSLDLSRLILLQDVYFCECKHVDMIFGLNSSMTRLKRLQLRWCSSLRTCYGLGDLVALEELDMSYCKMLEEVPHLGRLQNLRVLRVEGCSCIKAMPGLGDLVSLKEFKAMGCHNLVELPINMRKLMNVQTVSLMFCQQIKAVPGLSHLIGLENLNADYGGLGGCDGLHKLKKLRKVCINGWGAQSIPCLADLHSLKSVEICFANGVDVLTGVSNLRRIQELQIWYCDFTDVSCLSNLTALRSLVMGECNKLERLPNMHKLLRLESLKISSCKSLKSWESGSGSRQFGGDLCIVGALLCLQKLSLKSNVALTELPDLSWFPQLKYLRIYNSERLTSLTSSAPLTALEYLSLQCCGVVRALRFQIDLSHVLSPISLKLWRSEVLHEIEKLQVMCPLFRHRPQLGCNMQHLTRRGQLLHHGTVKSLGGATK